MADEKEEVVPGEENNESPEQKADKDTKKYLAIMETVKAVVGGAKNLKPAKSVTGDVTAEIVAELFAEEQETLRVSVKDGLRALLKANVELEVEISKKEKELKELQLRKRKEFTQAANNWLQKIDRGAVMQKSYETALETAFKNEAEKKD